MDYKKFYEDISIHVEMMVTPEMRMHACADPVHHDLSFQIFRLLSGYDEALKELDKLQVTKVDRCNAFYARLAYELNCEAKYDRPHGPSKVPKVGERIQDFAKKYGCTVDEMKKVLPEVERYMEHGI